MKLIYSFIIISMITAGIYSYHYQSLGCRYASLVSNTQSKELKYAEKNAIHNEIDNSNFMSLKSFMGGYERCRK